MNPVLEQLLRCPFCGGRITTIDALERRDGELRYGVLACARCRGEFAVVEGVPILHAEQDTLDIRCDDSGETVLEGPRLREVIQAVRNGDRLRAFSLLLNPIDLEGAAWPLRPAVPTSDPRRRRMHAAAPDTAAGSQTDIGTGRAGRLARVYRRVRFRLRRLSLPHRRRRLAAHILGNRDRLTGAELFDLYYRHYSGHPAYAAYFTYRWGQPRHLAALSLAWLLAPSTRPLLDVACGAGHLSHYLSYERADRPVIGLDRSFFPLFVARNFIAPGAQFVCCPADRSLPFADAAFGGVLCSDAFHYFRHKKVAIGEFRRAMVDDGVMVITRAGNRAVEPNEGCELDVDGYRALFGGLRCQVQTETALRSRYLQKRGPDLAQAAADASAAKWLSFVASRDDAVFRTHGAFDDWPHAVGCLGVNPIFAAERIEAGATHYRFEFPDRWYAYEDEAYREYTAAECRVSREVEHKLAQGKRTPAVEAHLRRFELMGMPERFLEAGGTRP